MPSATRSMQALRENITPFMADENLALRVKLECYLLVALGVREAGLIMVPVELPGFGSVGMEIDDEFYWRSTGRRRPGQPFSEYWPGRVRDVFANLGKGALEHRIGLLRDIFCSRVLDTPVYKAHLSWAATLGLSVKECEVRPTIREIWVYRSADTGDEIERLGALRQKLRVEAQKNPQASSLPYYRAFPEEASHEFVGSLGKLLGYPECCLDSYIRDRSLVKTSAEMRAAQQITEFGEQNRALKPEAYFVKDFFPCAPDCEYAFKKGSRALKALAELDASLFEKYRGILAANLEMVRNCPALIQEHAEDLNRRMASFM